MKNCWPPCGPIPGHHNQKLDPDQDLVARLDDFGPLLRIREVEDLLTTDDAPTLFFLDEVWRRVVGGRISEMARVNATP